MSVIRIVLSDGQKMQINNRDISDVAHQLNNASSANLTMVEVDKGTWINPQQITAMFVVG